ncbi:MAG: hypothetical protein IPJ24_04930 [bacterium]|nr:hypothetical protein [bacterium]
MELWKKKNSQLFHRRMLKLARDNDANGVAEWLNIDIDKAKDFVAFAAGISSPSLDGAEDAIDRMSRMFLSLIKQLDSGRFHLSKVFSIEVNTSPSVAASGQFPLDFDLSGGRLSMRKRGVDLAEVALNVLPQEDATHFLFLWHRRFDKTFSRFFASLKEADEGSRRVLLSQMLIMHCENLTISPMVVDAWSRMQRGVVERLFLDTLYRARPYSSVPAIDFFGEWTT